jgi:hypothetical protein
MIFNFSNSRNRFLRKRKAIASAPPSSKAAVLFAFGADFDLILGVLVLFCPVLGAGFIVPGMPRYSCWIAIFQVRGVAAT